MRGARRQITVLILFSLALTLLSYATLKSGGHEVQASDDLDEKGYLPIVIREPTPGPAADPIYCDWFPQGSSPNWYALECLDDGASYAGTYEIQRINVSFTQAWCICRILRDHYAIEVDARLIQGDADYRIFFDDDIDIEDSGEFYTFGVNPKDGTYSLMRVDDGGEWVPLIDWTSSPHIQPDNEVNRLRIERDGAEIEVAVNGHHLARIEDATYQDGTEWGLYTRNYEPDSVLHFNNMEGYFWDNTVSFSTTQGERRTRSSRHVQYGD